MDLEQTLTTAEKLKEALSSELERARDERRLLRTLDSARLMERAAKREHFNSSMVVLQREFQTNLETVGQRLGMNQVSVEALSQREPEASARLSVAVAEVRALAGALSELDALNRALGERTLGVVRGYISAIVPRTAAYDRQGIHKAPGSSTTRSTRV
jgi:hypothetical protein